MIDNITVFRTASEARGIFDTFLGGIFLVKGITIPLQLILYAFIPLLFVQLYFYYIEPNNTKGNLAKINTLSIFSISTLLLFQPWDEVFVNLKHSYNLAHFGTFSFSPLKPIEGTVDFLPYFILGCCAKLGLPLLEMIYFQGVLGGILCLIAGQKILKKLQFSKASIYGFCLIPFYLPLLLNSSHGFTTNYFTAIILWSIYFLFFEASFKWGFICLSLIPLVRIEGIFCFFILALLLLKRVSFKSLVLSALPFVVFSLWRFWYYGSLLAIPIQFKSSIGSFFYFFFGIRNFAADLIATHSITTIAIILLMSKMLPSNNEMRTVYKLLLALFICSLPYYISGGDWFPSSWGRYLFPFSFFAFLLAFSRMREFLCSNPTPQGMLMVIPILFIFIFESIPSFGSYHRFLDYALAPRKMLAEIRPKTGTVLPYRVHYLSQVGFHLLKNTDVTDRIATSEVATINYFAEREAIDFLGITNMEIASGPLRETPQLWRKSPRENELPYLIFKRLNPTLVEKYKPEFIYPFDFQLLTLLKDVPTDEWKNENIQLAYRRWLIKFQGLMRPVYGGVDSLKALGYVPIVVLYEENEFATLYFVSKSNVEKHFATLIKNGFVRN